MPEVERAHDDAVAPEQRAQLLLDVVLDLDALVGEDLAHRVLRERAVQDAVDDRLDEIVADVDGQPARDLADALGVDARSGP